MSMTPRAIDMVTEAAQAGLREENQRLRTYAEQLKAAVEDARDGFNTIFKSGLTMPGGINVAHRINEYTRLLQGMALDAALAKNPPMGPPKGVLGSECLSSSTSRVESPLPEAEPRQFVHEIARKGSEVRLDSDGKLDEVVGSDAVMENLERNHWFIEIGDVAVWLHSKSPITATYERRPDTSRTQSGKKPITIHTVKSGYEATFTCPNCNFEARARAEFQVNRQSIGVDAIAEERARQISAEGWTPEHDDEHSDYEMAQAAIAYIAHAKEQGPLPRAVAKHIEHQIVERWWQWDMDWWKPRDPRRNLVRAGALIAAEIDRIDRLNTSRTVADNKQG